MSAFDLRGGAPGAPGETQAAVRCRTCGGPTQGYKCDVCGAESPVHVESHRCGGPHCMPKCAACYEAEALCDCEPIAKR